MKKSCRTLIALFLSSLALFSCSNYSLTDVKSVEEDVSVRAVSVQSNVSSTVIDQYAGKTFIFVKASSAPKLWAWEQNGVALSEKCKENWPGNTMTAVTSSMMNNPEGWYYKDFSSVVTGKKIKFMLNGNNSVAYEGPAGTFWFDNGTISTSDPTTADLPSADSVKIYISANSAPKIWVWQPEGYACSELMGLKWTGPEMSAASDLENNKNWYVYEVASKYYKAGKSFKIAINGSEVNTSKSSTFWYDAIGVNGSKGTFYDSDPTKENIIIPPTGDDVNIYVSAYSTPKIWVWQPEGKSCSELMGYSWTGPSMSNAEGLKNGTNWYVFKVSSEYYTAGKTFTFAINGTEVKTSKTATFWYDAEGVSGTKGAFYDSDPTDDSIIIPPVPGESVKVYVSSSSAPNIWVWQPEGKACSQLMGYTWTGPVMEAATGLIYGENWFVFDIPSTYYDSGKTFTFAINGVEVKTSKTATFWYDAEGVSGNQGAFYDSDPTTKPVPVTPKVTIKPASGKIVGPSDFVSATFDYGKDEENFSGTVTINGTTYDWGNDFTGKNFSISLKSLGFSTEAEKITIRATAKNSVGTVSDVSVISYVPEKAEDPFTWDNVNAYFVLTDRFYNGDSSNDYSYYRKNGLSGDENVATFHGGDLAGLTQKIDYFDKLGVNAIWITAPYEQIHGWVGGKDNAFPHYAFHGYYTLDWSSMDQNMGTVEEFRTFVNACHSKGIRVIMDVVMNHVGYNNPEDMYEYGYGTVKHNEHGWLQKTSKGWNANDGIQDEDWSNLSAWDSWFGPWIRSFRYNSGSEYGGSCGGLPDVKTELRDSVGMAPVLVTKWNKDSSAYKAKYYNPSVAHADWNGYSGDYRTDKGIAPGDYQIVWLSAWVRELGIDGFRCDTAKHVEPWRWGQLKVACSAALEAWRNDSSKSKLYNGKDTGAADWDESFWMTGECFGWTSTAGQGDYYTTGGFDSMINFSFNGCAGFGVSKNYPTVSNWSSYLNINSNSDSDGNGNRNNVLTYLSSHDTKLCRTSDQISVGTMFELLPGGIQIYYGDETSRPLAYTGCGDSDMMTRGDFNWDEANGATANHWGKVGTFRKYNPAVGAGTGSATKRSYSGPAGENKIAISISGSTVDVSGLFEDGTTVYNWYDGTSAVVNGSSVKFAGGTTTTPILISEKNPEVYGVNF